MFKLNKIARNIFYCTGRYSANGDNVSADDRKEIQPKPQGNLTYNKHRRVLCAWAILKASV